MKKYLVVLIALLFATGAFAQEAEKKAVDFKYGFYGLSFMDSTSYKAGDEKVEYDYTHVRVKPSFSIGNENVKGVVVFEIDQNFGAPGADKGTDNMVVEVKHAYFQVKDILLPNLTVTTGLFGYAFPLLIDNDFGMSQASYDFGMGNVNLSYIKTVEGSVYNKESEESAGVITVEKTKDDVQTVALDAVVKAGPVNIKPAYMFAMFGKDNGLGTYAPTLDDDVFTLASGNMSLYGISVDGGVDALSFAVSYVMAKGEADWVVVDHDAGAISEVENTKINTYAFDAEVSYKLDPVKVGVFYTQYSGSKEADFENGKLKSHVWVMDNVYGAPDGRLFILDAAGTQNLGGTYDFDLGAWPMGLKIYGANVEAAVAKLTVFAQYAFVQSAQKYEINGSKKSGIGQEIDLKAAYEVAPATSLFAEYGYVSLVKQLTDSGKKGTIQSVVVGMSTKI